MESKKPLVSVVIAAYNAEKYIDKLLDSVCCQTYVNLEIIVVNDGSTDSTAEKVSNRKRVDDRIILFEQRNSGVSRARNAGLEIAKGEYIIFVDADDLLHSSMIQTLVDNALEHDADVSICNIRKCETEADIEKLNLVNDVTYLNRQDALQSFLLGKVIRTGAWNKLIRADILNGVRFEEGKRVNEDKFFCFQIIYNSPKIVYSSAELYCYMQRDGSATKKKFDERWFDTTYFADKMYDQLKNTEYEKYARYSMSITYYSLAKMMVEADAQKEYPKEYKQTIERLRNLDLDSIGNYFARSTYLGIRIIKLFVPLFEFFTRQNNR